MPVFAEILQTFPNSRVLRGKKHGLRFESPLLEVAVEQVRVPSQVLASDGGELGRARIRATQLG